MSDWRMTTAQMQAQDARHVLRTWDDAIATIEQQLEVALGAEGEFTSTMTELGRRLAEVEIAARNRPSVWTGTEHVPGITYEDRAEYDRLKNAMAQAERERQEWIRRTGLTEANVRQRLQRATMGRARAAEEVARLEAQMTPGELVQAGIPSPDFQEHRERVQALRERIGAAS